MDLVDSLFDLFLAILLVIGNLLALPLWWWLFGSPIARFWKRCHGKDRKC